MANMNNVNVSMTEKMVVSVIRFVQLLIVSALHRTRLAAARSGILGSQARAIQKDVAFARSHFLSPVVPGAKTGHIANPPAGDWILRDKWCGESECFASSHLGISRSMKGEACDGESWTAFVVVLRVGKYESRPIYKMISGAWTTPDGLLVNGMCLKRHDIVTFNGGAIVIANYAPVVFGKPMQCLPCNEVANAIATHLKRAGFVTL